ncbi:MAG: hypothetical protein CMF64_07710 [Magnetovibrio sp.]|nr:hypothetical protein [Magnetovibrio sp.]
MKLPGWLIIGLSLLVGLAPSAVTAQPTQSAEMRCTGELDAVVAAVFAAADQRTTRDLCRPEVQQVSIPAGDGELIKIKPDALPKVGAIQFYGLAGFYNVVQAYRMRDGEVEPLSSVAPDALRPSDWIVLSGRYDALVLRSPGAEMSFTGETVGFSSPAGTPLVFEAVVAPKRSLAAIHPEWDNLEFAHLWNWLGALAGLIEQTIVALHEMTGLSWGITILLFAVALKIILLPTSLLTVRLQQSVDRHQSILAPQLAEIKANYKGEEAHNRIMAAHKALGITPFYTLKPMLVTAIHIPILVALFAALGEMSEFDGVSFLWIDDLSLPDTVGTLEFALPGLGDRISLLPFVMTAATVASALLVRDPSVHADVLKSRKRNLYFMAAGFFLLFYPFPAVMVYYFTLANILHTVFQQFSKPSPS